MNLTFKGSDYFAESAFIGRAGYGSLKNTKYVALLTVSVDEIRGGSAITECVGTSYQRKVVGATVGYGNVGIGSTQSDVRSFYNLAAMDWAVSSGDDWGTVKAIGLCESGTKATDDVYWVATIGTPKVMSALATLSIPASNLVATMGPSTPSAPNRVWGKWYGYEFGCAHLMGISLNPDYLCHVCNWNVAGPQRALSIHLSSDIPNAYNEFSASGSRGEGEFTEWSTNGYMSLANGAHPMNPNQGGQKIMFTKSAATTYPQHVSNSGIITFPPATGLINPRFALILNWYLASGGDWAAADCNAVLAVIPLWDTINNRSYWQVQAGGQIVIDPGALQINVD